jgi:hypothetical protein
MLTVSKPVFEVLPTVTVPIAAFAVVALLQYQKQASRLMALRNTLLLQQLLAAQQLMLLEPQALLASLTQHLPLT